MTRPGRPQKPYRASWGKDIQGLYKCPDGRWRINATGQKFTEPDERLAVARFKAWEAANKPTDLGTIRLHQGAEAAMADIAKRTLDAGGSLHATVKGTGREGQSVWAVADHSLSPDQWAWLRQQLIVRADWVGEQVGLPQLARIVHMAPAKSIRLTRIKDLYRSRTNLREQSKTQALKCMQRLIDHATATTLDDLSTEKLIAFREIMEGPDSTLQTEQSRRWFYGQIKAVLAYALKAGENAEQVQGALSRMKVLFTELVDHKDDPRPMTRTDFHKLLKADPAWRPWLLMALNCCMYLDDLCQLTWADVDLDKGTLSSRRRKKGQCPRGAVLWPDTIEALKWLRPHPKYVFISSHGTAYVSAGRYNDFADLRQAAKLPDDLKFSHIRDAAYTAASEGTSDERKVRVLAGHKAPGLQDRYVLRNPQLTAEPCEAIRQRYGPF